MATTTSPTRLVKWPTALDVHADAILSALRSEENDHTLQATMFDLADVSTSADLTMWARHPPEEGAYILSGVPAATGPFRMIIQDTSQMRMIPDSLDGSDIGKPTLPDAPIVLSGVAVVKSVDKDRKVGVLAGLQFFSKQVGWLRFEISVFFEPYPRWSAWTIPVVRSLVSFTCHVARTDSDGRIEGVLRKISYVGEAHRALIQELGFGQSPASDKAARLLEARQSKRKMAQTQDGDGVVLPFDQNGTESSGGGDDAALSPVTPTPVAPIRKRGRAGE